MKSLRLFILPILLLISSASQAALITEIGGITIGSNPGTYTATFHDFDTPQSYNTLFGSGGHLESLDNDSISATFNEWALVRDFIISSLGTTHHVDSTFGPSDAFVFWAAPIDAPLPPLLHYMYADISSNLGIGTPYNQVIDDTSLLFQGYASVTFQRTASSGTAPTPATMFLLIAGLLGFSAAGSRRRRR